MTYMDTHTLHSTTNTHRPHPLPTAVV